MDHQGHLVTRLHGSGLPPDTRQMFRAGHFNAPLVFVASIVLDEQLYKDMGIAPAEVLDGSLQRYRFRLVEHRKRMVRKRRACRQHYGDGYEVITPYPTHLFLRRPGIPCLRL